MIKKYFKDKGITGCNVCLQLLKPESVLHYELSLTHAETKNDQLVCIESMKLSLLAKSCLCPGLVALVTNLIKSSDEQPGRKKNKYNIDMTSKDWDWLLNYWKGKKYEIY